MNKITAIYVRRSVSDQDKGNNSLSIDAQKAECIRYLGDESNYRIYCDDGKSGKDITHRPAFMQMMADAKEGLIDRITQNNIRLFRYPFVTLGYSAFVMYLSQVGDNNIIIQFLIIFSVSIYLLRHIRRYQI